jgi:indoleamine 2,3-dioxygenase
MGFTLNSFFTRRGFLPEPDPAWHFPADSEFTIIDELGRDLPSLLRDPGCRQYLREQRIPSWPAHRNRPQDLPQLQLYYLRLGFLASAYINQVGEPRATVLPANIARPLCQACALLERPPILSYDGYALYNWKRFRSEGPIALGNIDTLQNFVHLYDEHWFILVHVEIEALTADILSGINRLLQERWQSDLINQVLQSIGKTVWRQVAILKRIPEQMDPALYYRTFRPYIRYFEHVVYEGMGQNSMDFRGETGAQSSVMPTLVALLKIPHQRSSLTEHLADMRRYMPRKHLQLIKAVEELPELRPYAEKEIYNSVLEAMASFREFHYGLAWEYIQKRTEDPFGTGGTPYVRWLKQLIDETRAHRIS